MSVAFTREEDAESAASHLPDRPISPHPNLVTATGLADLDAALAAAKEAYAAAAADKDLQKDRSAMARAIRDLRYYGARRASAQLLQPDTAGGSVVFGSRVTFRREETQTFRIVGEDEADAARGSVSYVSPLAKELMGKVAGDVAMLNGKEIEILSIE